jgi:hypothetical protein
MVYSWEYSNISALLPWNLGPITVQNGLDIWKKIICDWVLEEIDDFIEENYKDTCSRKSTSEGQVQVIHKFNTAKIK